MKDWLILILNKASPWKMVKVENAIDMYYAVENANTYKTRKQTCSKYEKT